MPDYRPTAMSAKQRPVKLPVQQMLTTDELAVVTRTSPSTVRYWRHTGYGPKGVKVGRRVLYAVPEVEEWLERLQTEAGA